eukprot:CAMPEP_0171377778 /NCGR_PEP_ID=MMETSP0879-20121228/22101_1 /TAXON_ID=67004 /ORGANISM="Thalassiosira weissflogii, Strain CCMP1336" /LENGTH=568 /DNA_ID=CAMNT_0011888003 /DNA_START=122 /DNA_END=1824 /DNA_ORIENTATION=+
MSSSPASNGFHQEPTIVKLPPLSPTTAENTSAPPPPATSTTPTTSSPANDPNRHRPQLPDPSSSSPRLSSTWDPDSLTAHCTSCRSPFDPLFHRRHHCRLCGRLFCQNCSNTRSLIPPSALVLKRAGSGGDDHSYSGGGGRSVAPSFAPRDDGDECLTYVRSPSQRPRLDDDDGNDDHRDDDTLLYGRGLERRILLARHPQRTCHPCRVRLAPLQEELCLRNSNAMRYNYIDEGDAVRRLCNSPLAFTLGHEVRKAAYALGNLLPGRTAGGGADGRLGGGGSGRLGAFLSTGGGGSNSNNDRDDDGYDSYPPPQADPCYAPRGASCKTLDPTLRHLDGVHIPARLLRRARGVAIVTAAKGGLGFAGFEFGTGLVVARRRGGNVNDSDHGNDPNNNHYGNNNTANDHHATNPIQRDEPSPDAWSAPSAIAVAGFAWGALLGAQVSDHVFLLMTDDALRLFSSDDGRSIHLGADVGVAIGPLGRAAEADVGASAGVVAPIYTYSLSKGLYAGASLDGRIVVSRPRVNEKFYGRAVTSKELLSGEVPSPPAAQPLYDALKRCRVYGGGDGG